MTFWVSSLVSLVALSVAARAAVIVPGATWTDTSGNVIQAHGGGFLKVSDLGGKKQKGPDNPPRLAPRSTGLARTRHTIVGSSGQFRVIL